ncbi:class I SAM-dependent methyltransferase [Algoriphagus sp. PAP.12]|uniref:class I SAM-dependent methyltransferase n=1 Tax=Algoriphagus sp. PAP.12 TaxID=2996678 RepID=UPI00227A914A|nr:class I SAM-dependent methyltransferase [Algoriphagus sp. PAP.12]
MKYPGKELALFEKAKNWKRYYSSQLIPEISGRVAEVGAGLGGTTSFLFNSKVSSWTCFEPDTELFEKLSIASQSWEFRSQIKLENRILPTVYERYDTILYIDVLEHIKQDRDELEKAISALNVEGHLIILVPAFNFLFSRFDQSIGHFRRYNKGMLKAILPQNVEITRFRYLDTMGFLSSFANKQVLRQPYPRPSQIQFWDSTLIPISKVFDKVLFHSFGKTLILICEKSAKSH